MILKEIREEPVVGGLLLRGFRTLDSKTVAMIISIAEQSHAPKSQVVRPSRPLLPMTLLSQLRLEGMEMISLIEERMEEAEGDHSDSRLEKDTLTDIDYLSTVTQ